MPQVCSLDEQATAHMLTHLVRRMRPEQFKPKFADFLKLISNAVNHPQNEKGLGIDTLRWEVARVAEGL